MNKTRLASLILAIVLMFSIVPPTVAYADAELEFVPVRLSMYSNLSNRTSITGFYRDNTFYIALDDIVDMSGVAVVEANNEIVSFIVSRMRQFTLYVESSNLREYFPNAGTPYNVHMPSTIKDGTVYISAFHFLQYIGAHVQLDRDADIQLMVAVRYNIFDALADFVDMERGHFFWWDEIEYTGRSLENRLTRSGVIALINRDSNIFRMIFDPRGIEREAIEEVLMDILMNSGGEHFSDENIQSDFMNLASDLFGVQADVVEFITTVYTSDATAEFARQLSDLADGASLTVSFVSDALSAIETMRQFDRISETQRTLLENTILTYYYASPTLRSYGWDNILRAARNVDARAKDIHTNRHMMGLDLAQSTAYSLAEGASAVGLNPAALAWRSVVLVNQWLPITSRMIDQHTQIYNAYNGSMVQVVANELLVDSFSRIYYSDLFVWCVVSQYNSQNRVRDALVLQLQSTLTTREYLLRAGNLDDAYARTLERKNREIAELLNRTINAPVVFIGEAMLYTGDVVKDIGWMAEIESVGNWEVALEDFLSEFLPFFTSPTTMWDDWEVGGWKRFVRPYRDDLWFEYGTEFAFYDPVTGNRVQIDDVPYLRQEIPHIASRHPEFGSWGAQVTIATDFTLYDLDSNGIPDVLISWESDVGWFASGDGGWELTVHRYIDGTYELVGGIWGPYALYLDDNREPIFLRFTYNAGFMDADSIVFNDRRMDLVPIIERIEWERFYSHQIDEYVAIDPFQFPVSDWWEAFPTTIAVPGVPDGTWILIEQMAELQERLTETITQRLRAEGRVI